jgi:hypothetical protein
MIIGGYRLILKGEFLRRRKTVGNKSATPQKPKLFDPRQVLNDSPLPRHNGPGINRNDGPS